MSKGLTLLDQYGRPFPKRREASPRLPAPRSKFDAAQTNVDSSRHWANADSLSPNAALSPEVRNKLRQRARYELANNSYASGIVQTLTNDVVGTGPRLQLQTPDVAFNRRVEKAFYDWACGAHLAEKLRILKSAKTGSGGEGIAVLANNPVLPTPVQLDLRVVEGEQLCAPWGQWFAQDYADGVRFDRYGNPSEYTILRHHPGEGYGAAFPADFDRYPASQVIHWFRKDRPGQARGIPEITPALPLFAQLRRYTLAVIAAAETAADFAAVLQTAAGAEDEDLVGEPFETLEIEKRMMTTLPAGYTLSQFKAEQPTTTYEMFKREILNEVARCLNVPYNVAAGNSASYNYASGRLDHQTYFKSCKVERDHCEQVVLDPLFVAWLDEAVLIPGFIPEGMTPFVEWPWQWFWPGWEHVDPQKEATAQETRLRNHTTTLAREYAKEGLDWEEQIRQRALEKKRMRELGLTEEEAGPGQTEPQEAEEEESYA